MSKKRLLIFSTTKVDDNLKKGNMPFLRHYETYFDEVICYYQTGEQFVDFVDGNTRYISNSCSKSSIRKILNLLLLPINLYSILKKYKPTHVSTPDIVFGGYSWILVKLFTVHRLICYPVCVPESIYSFGQTLTNKLPAWIEKILIKFTFLISYKIVDAKNFSAVSTSNHWVLDWIYKKDKFVIIDKLPDALPTPLYFEELLKHKKEVKSKRSDSEIVLVCASRLHKEKLIYDLLDMIQYLSKKYNVQMHIYGDGEEKKNFIKEIKRRKLDTFILVKGFIKNQVLPEIYSKADIFVSPYTGSSLREAMLCGLPVVAYKLDWIGEMFENRKNILYAEPKNPIDMAMKIEDLINDKNLYYRLHVESKKYASEFWGTDDLNLSIQEMFK